MELTILGHEDLYAVEQLQLALFSVDAPALLSLRFTGAANGSPPLQPSLSTGSAHALSAVCLPGMRPFAPAAAVCSKAII